MFDDFLENATTYSQVEQFWLDLFWGIIDEKNQDRSAWISPYYNTCFSDGRKFMDGNPIFSSKNKINNKSIRVIQEGVNDFDGVQSRIDRKEKNELVIICSLTNDNLEKIKKLITEWVIH
jgi:hypothetical protein